MEANPIATVFMVACLVWQVVGYIKPGASAIWFMWAYAILTVIFSFAGR
jgi:quinol-cytochrome oxidoreductase complex cytochrome b subunit